MRKNTIKSPFVIMSLFLGLLFFTSCNETKKTEKIKPNVALSSFALYDVASHIAKDSIELIKIIPAGVDIHSYEPTPQKMAQIESSDLVFYNGAGLEPWIASFHFKQKAVALGDFIPLKALTKSHEEHHDHSSHCDHGVFDPHIWFDIENMKHIAEIITYELITLAPKNKDLYLANRDGYIQKLETLDVLYKSTLQSCKLKTIITNHNAFSYLSDKYGFEIETLNGLSPDKEVSPKDVIRVLESVKKHKVPVVFFENFASSKSMQSIASEANVELDSLHPLGNITKDDLESNRTYEDIMKENLYKISKALHCQ